MEVSQARVAVLMGGQSDEHDVSLASGGQVLQHLEAASKTSVIIRQDGLWVFGGEAAVPMGAAIDRICQTIDVVFIALHGPNGEDGSVQGVFELLGVPYTFSDVVGASCSMDKIRTKFVYEANGLPTAQFGWASRASWSEKKQVALQQAQNWGFDIVLKPARAGSSFGVQFPQTEDAFVSGIHAIFERGGPVLFEPRLYGRELTCGVIEHGASGRCEALPVTEIIPGAQYEYFDYEAKYTPGASQEVTPAEIHTETAERMQVLAVEAHRALGLRDLSRTDFFLTKEGQIQLLETNSIPGFTPNSLVPQAAAVAGYSFAALVQLFVENALARADSGPMPC